MDLVSQVTDLGESSNETDEKLKQNETVSRLEAIASRFYGLKG